jgi:hypothetical protein
MSKLDWIKQADRGVCACIAFLKPQLLAKWGVNWVEGHVEEKKSQEKNWTFDGSCNAITDTMAKRMMDVPQTRPVEPWKLLNSLGWKCTSTKNGKPIVGNLLNQDHRGYATKIAKLFAKFATSKLFSDVRNPLGCSYSAERHIDNALVIQSA